MNEQNKKKAIVLGVLGIALVVVLYLQFTGETAPVASGTKTAMNQPGIAVGTGNAAVPQVSSVFQRSDVDIDQLIQSVSEVEFDYASEHVSRNPTLPLVGGVSFFRARMAEGETVLEADDLLYAANRKELTGIIWNDARPLAVVDNEVVHVGYRFIEPIEVKAIEQGRIVLAIDGQDVEIVKELKEQ
jgi:hypothetical protein